MYLLHSIKYMTYLWLKTPWSSLRQKMRFGLHFIMLAIFLLFLLVLLLILLFFYCVLTNSLVQLLRIITIIIQSLDSLKKMYWKVCIFNIWNNKKALVKKWGYFYCSIQKITGNLDGWVIAKFIGSWMHECMKIVNTHAAVFKNHHSQWVWPQTGRVHMDRGSSHSGSAAENQCLFLMGSPFG